MNTIQFVAQVVVALVFLVHQSLACFSTFKNSQNITFVQQDCTKSAGVTAIPSPEDLAKEETNDKVKQNLLIHRKVIQCNWQIFNISSNFSVPVQMYPERNAIGKQEAGFYSFYKCNWFLTYMIIYDVLQIDNEGRIDKDLLLDFMESNAPEAYLLKLSELASTCTETSGADKIQGGAKMGKSMHECKPMKKFYSCFLLGAEKVKSSYFKKLFLRAYGI